MFGGGGGGIELVVVVDRGMVWGQTGRKEDCRKDSVVR